MRFTLALALAGLLACGGGGGAPRAPVEGRPSGGAATDATDPVPVLAALARAARADDGRGLDALIHPELGLWLWMQPGAAIAPYLRLSAGAGEPPRARLRADERFDAYWREHYWPQVAEGLERGLARLDRDPAERHAPIYGDCGDMERTDLRAWLVSRDDLGLAVELAADYDVRFDPRVTRDLAHFRAWGLDVYLVRDRDRWWVAHVMVWTPCDA